MVAARISRELGLDASLSECATFGTAVGMAAGSLGGWVVQALQRVVDVLIAMPSLVLGLVLATVLRPGVTTLLLAVLVTGWTPFARLAAGLTVG